MDLSNGLADDREQVLPAPPDVPSWAENLLFAPYDPATQIGMWLHLGTVPTEWSLWEDRVLITLPEDEGVLTLWAYHRTEPARRPAGANLAFTCLEPYRRWRVSFDGFCLRTPYEQMRTGLVVDGEKVRCTVDLDVTCATPVWDAHEAAQVTTGAGSMREQSWATEHYEQLYRATGTVRVGDRTIDFDGTGWRDHSRGPRGGTTGAAWGGHVILGALFDSGKALGLSRYWSPDGAITLEGGYVVVDGVLHHARVVDVPRLTVLQRGGETLPIGLEWDGGRLDVQLTTTTSCWMSFDAGLPYGVKPGFSGCTYSVAWGEVEWDGEPASVYLERSDPLPGNPS